MLDLCREFKLVELTEIMLQKGDANFIKLLNNIVVGNGDSYADDILTLFRMGAKRHPY